MPLATRRSERNPVRPNFLKSLDTAALVTHGVIDARPSMPKSHSPVGGLSDEAIKSLESTRQQAESSGMPILPVAENAQRGRKVMSCGVPALRVNRTASPTQFLISSSDVNYICDENANSSHEDPTQRSDILQKNQSTSSPSAMEIDIPTPQAAR